MGCSSCSTSDTNISPGCKNNGTCGTGGCNKLNVYDWLSDMELPDGQKPFNIVEVRFKGSRKEFFRNTDYLELKTGDMVAVEGNPGHDVGSVSMAGELVRLQLKANGMDENSDQVKALYRLARPADLEKYESVKALEFDTMHKARSIALKLNLKMKLSDVEYQGDGKKATFYYTADERVDFRELIKKLAEEFHTRIEMRQIGMRQEASRLGGIGSCGRELCCSTWLTDFKIVSTSAARYQNLSLNPTKLAGQCGKLKCCLNYELDSYMEAIRDIPEANVKLETEKGLAVHRKTDIFKRMMWFAYADDPSGGTISSDTWIPLQVDRVKEIIALNKQGEKPLDLHDFAEVVVEEKKMDYADVVGQDSLTRMMDKKKHRKKKKKGHKEEKGQEARSQAQPSQQQKLQRDDRNKPRQGGQPKPQNQPQKQGKKQPGNVPEKPVQHRSSEQQSGRPPRTPVKPQKAEDSKNPPSSAPPEQKRGDDNGSRNRNLPPRVKPPDK